MQKREKKNERQGRRNSVDRVVCEQEMDTELEGTGAVVNRPGKPRALECLDQLKSSTRSVLEQHRYPPTNFIRRGFMYNTPLGKA